MSVSIINSAKYVRILCILGHLIRNETSVLLSMPRDVATKYILPAFAGTSGFCSVGYFCVNALRGF